MTEVDIRGINVVEEIEEDPILFTSKIAKEVVAHKDTCIIPYSQSMP